MTEMETTENSSEKPVNNSEEVLDENNQAEDENNQVENSNENATEQPEVESTETVSTPPPSYELTVDIANTLKCTLCHGYLSVPPIYIISEDGSKYKCGRCTIRTHINTRATMFENLAKYMVFPCIFKNCPEKLPWTDVKEHEKDCEHRTISCIALHCDEQVLLSEFFAHFKDKHSKSYFSDSMNVNNLHASYGLSVIEKDGIHFVVTYDRDQFKFGVNVCTFQSHNKRFELRLSSSGSNYSIALSDQLITPFDERVHCQKCLKGVCKNECHVYAYYSKGILKRMTLKVERDVLKRTFGSKDIVYTINIIDEKSESDEVDLDDILHGKEMIIDEVNDEEENEVVAENEQPDLLQEMMNCPNCKVAMIPPIHECLAGHTLCSECKSKHEKCPTCESAIENTRNYILEEVAANLKLSTQNEPAPEANKPALDKEIICPLSKCFDKITLSSINSHFQENHIDNFHFNKFTLKNVYAYYNVDVLVKNDKVYLVLFDFDDMNFGISMCSLEKDPHQYEVKLSSANGKYSITAVGQRIIQFNEKHHCFKCSTGTCKNTDHTFRTRRKEVFRRLTTKINRDYVRRMFGTSNMNYNITIVPAKSSAQKDKIIRQLFECPICKDYMVPPISQCVAGHTLCSSCKSKLEKCPSCEGKIEETRNHVLEALAEMAELPCQFETDNCTFRGGVKRIASHEAECPLKSKRACVEKKNT